MKYPSFYVRQLNPSEAHKYRKQEAAGAALREAGKSPTRCAIFRKEPLPAGDLGILFCTLGYSSTDPTKPAAAYQYHYSFDWPADCLLTASAELGFPLTAAVRFRSAPLYFPYSVSPLVVRAFQAADEVLWKWERGLSLFDKWMGPGLPADGPAWQEANATVSRILGG